MDQIGGVLRAILGAIGGYFVAKGVVSTDMLNTIVGAVVTLVTAGWSIWTNKPGTTIPPKTS